jgi:NADPH-dependent glutamate synthase beta subunit-like oxidoreductase
VSQVIWKSLIKSEQYHELDGAFSSYLIDQGLSWSDFEDSPLTPKDPDANLVTLAVQLEGFLLSMFPVGQEYRDQQEQLSGFKVLEQFLQTVAKPAVRKLKIKADVDQSGVNQVIAVAEQYRGDELQCITKLMSVFDTEVLIQWFQFVWVNQEDPYIHWQSFAVPKRLDFSQLVSVTTYVPRYDYQYTGLTLSQVEVERQVNYCIDCHVKQNDSCSTGMVDRKTSTYKVSPLGRVLMGCPLNQKISQMHMLRKQRKILAALAITMMDNPLCAATGDRICNDCMAACIYQKFEPVDTPSVESNTLALVLGLPFGAEIYLLLARWNPLLKFTKKERHHMASVAVIGMGPAGIAMSYYLLRSGVSVMAFDGLAIREEVGNVKTPIACFNSWAEQLLADGPLCFGGVMDYGITARWDKRKIALLWALLHRFSRFRIKGHIRLGGAVTIPLLKQQGFDHVVLATGAGLPQAHPLQKHQGMYFANEFLMRLQISGMMHQTLQSGLSLPIVVIGGGLTAIDCATEAQVYYLKWVEQVAFWCDSVGYEVLTDEMSTNEKQQVLTWQAHGILVRSLRMKKAPEALKGFFAQAGEVSVVYRKSMQDSPAYKTNYLEVEKALEQGIVYVEHTNPVRVMTNDDGQVTHLVCEQKNQEVMIPACTVMFATGSKPNVAYYYERRHDLEISQGYYKRESQFFAISQDYPKFVSVIGDLHPDYQGSVVGALASAKDSYAHVLSGLQQGQYLPSEEVLQQLTITIDDWHESQAFIHLNIRTEISLPLGTYLRVTVFDEQRSLTQISAVVVDQQQAWVRADSEGVEDLKQGRVSGIMGPSGTRIVSQDVTQSVIIIADNWGLSWACSIGNSLKKQGKYAHLLLLSKSDIKLLDYFDQVTQVDNQNIPQSVFSTAVDLYCCVEAGQLKALQSQAVPARQTFAVVDGGMMCFLKGVCGQCIQWQIDEDGKSIKAVYACSWPAQPMTLIDVDHAITRQQRKDETLLYKSWMKKINNKEKSYV